MFMINIVCMQTSLSTASASTSFSLDSTPVCASSLDSDACAVSGVLVANDEEFSASVSFVSLFCSDVSV